VLLIIIKITTTYSDQIINAGTDFTGRTRLRESFRSVAR